MWSRRSWMKGAAALPAAAQAQTAGRPKNIVISSSNGLECCNIAHSWLRAGKDTLDAVIAGQRTFLRVDRIYRETLDTLLERHGLAARFSAARPPSTSPHANARYVP